MTFMQSNSNVMSIGAITCSAPETFKSRQSSMDSTLSSDFQLPSLMQTSGFMPKEYILQHKRSGSEATTVTSAAFSDHDTDSNCSGSPSPICKNSYSPSWLNSVYGMSDRKNMYNKESLLHTFDLNEFGRTMEYCDNIYASDRTNKMVRKGDALATRRARNKLASAKYRAKKQALTHAMQDRIMQLATQVMTLRDELNQTKSNEAEISARYERLATYFQQTNGKLPPLS